MEDLQNAEPTAQDGKTALDCTRLHQNCTKTALDCTKTALEDEIIATLKRIEEATNSQSTEPLSVRVDKRRIDRQKNYPMPQPLMCCNDTPFLTIGDLSAVTGVEGTRKTWWCKYLVAVYLNGGDEHFTIPPECVGGGVAWFDTEQGEPRTAQVLRTIQRMCGPAAGRLEIYSLRECDSPRSRLMIVAYAIAALHPKFVVIDGTADLATNTNDPTECTYIREFLMQWASKYKCHILNVIHGNQGDLSGKMRGWLGSEVQRKCGTAMKVAKKPGTDYSAVEFTKCRDVEPPKFKIAVVDSLPITEILEEPPKLNAKTDAAIQKVVDYIREETKRGRNGATYKELVEFICGAGGVKERRAKDILQAAVEAGRIFKPTDSNAYQSVAQEDEE